MRLSVRAKKLLDKNKISELQELLFEELVDPVDYKKYVELSLSKIAHVSSLCSIPDNLTDAAVLLKLDNACVISTGYIYSQKIVNILIRGDSASFYCPDSQKKILKNTYGEGAEKSSFIALPQVDNAIRCLKEINTLAHSPYSFNVAFKVSSSKLRIDITPLRQSNLFALKNVFTSLLPDSQSGAVINNDVGGYLVEDFGCCWIITPGRIARLEFWFPDEARLNDMQVNDAIKAFLTPLDLASTAPDAEEEFVFGSIESMKPRQYSDAFSPMQLTALQTARCCKNFLDYVTKFTAQELCIRLKNELIFGERPEKKAINSGVMFFSPLAAGFNNLAAPRRPTATSIASRTVAPSVFHRD